MVGKHRETGISVVSTVPWGSHICFFYNTSQDLVDILVPYFKAGLQNNECCIWITSGTISQKEAEEAMGKAMPDFSQYLASEKIEIIPHTDWYLKDDIFNGERVLNAWINKLERAMASGNDGLRVSGDTAWLERRDWNEFIAYEGEINRTIGKYNMLAFCTYPLHKHGASQAINVMSKHQYNLIKHKDELVLVGGSEREGVEEKEQAIISMAIDGFWTTDINGNILEVNDSYCRMIGYTREELLKMSISDVEALERPEDTATHLNNIILRGSDRFKTQHRCKDSKIIDIEINCVYFNVGKGQLLVFVHDLTVLDHAAESQEVISRVKSGKHPTELQERFIREGFKGFEDQAIIELLLSMVLPAQKAKHLAKACMEHFKTLSDFLAAPPNELQRIGITPACMLCIKLLHELPIKVLKQRIMARTIYQSSREVFDYLYYSMRDLKKEIFKVIYLNNRSQIIDIADLFEGSVDNVPIHPREIVESTLAQGATALIFVHNHPTGDPTPSRSDKQITRDLVFVGNILQIKVLDHIIIGTDRYYSFTDEGLIQKYQDNFLNLKIKGVLSSRSLYQIYRRLPKGIHHKYLSKLFTEYQLSFPDVEDISSSQYPR
jgi:DNA repair protein RadC